MPDSVMENQRRFTNATCPDHDSVVCVVGTIAGVFFAGVSIISITNMTVPWRGALLVTAMLVPVAFVVSGIGAWLMSSTARTFGLIALPWIYGILFVLLMLVSFKSRITLLVILRQNVFALA